MFRIVSSFVTKQKVSYVSTISIIGVILMLVFLNQLYSGIICALYTVNDSLLLVISRDEADIEELYSDDIFNLHERGVDLTFIILYLHLLRKFFLKSFYLLQISAWKSGSFLFLIVHGIIFFGLVLCCTHLSDITLKIAANIMQTIFFKYGKLSYLLFTNHTINTDTLIRMMYLHYILAIGIWGVIVLHLIDMHYGYRNNVFFKFIHQLLNWFGEIFKFEYLSTIVILGLFSTFILIYYIPNEALSYEIFMWGDIGLVTEVRFLSVAPHWYFRSYMGWLLFCPHHYLGIFGLIAFFVIAYFHPNIFNWFIKIYNNIKQFINFNKSFIWSNLYFIFIICILYTISYLPCGKYFTFVQGNIATTFSYLYVYIIWFIHIDLIIKKNIFNIFNIKFKKILIN